MSLTANFNSLLKQVESGYFLYKSAKNEKIQLEESLEEAKKKVRTIDKARNFFYVTAERTQRDVSDTLSVIITSAIRAVFDTDDYSCKIEFGTRANQTEARVLLYKDGNEIDDALNSVGGGLIDVASFAARVAYIFMSGRRRVLVADEPFKGVSEDIRHKCPEMLSMLSEQLGMQFIIVSHMKELIDGADNIITVVNGEVVS